MKSMRRLFRSQQGQGMTEYIIIVALVAIAAIACVTLFGDYIRKMFGASVNALADESTSSTGAQARYKVSAHRNVTDFATYGSNNPYSGPGNAVAPP
jgi:Flp pilus assembly pilin Flp